MRETARLMELLCDVSTHIHTEVYCVCIIYVHTHTGTVHLSLQYYCTLDHGRPWKTDVTSHSFVTKHNNED